MKNLKIADASFSLSPATLLKKETLAHVFQACNFGKKETLAQVFPCEFCEIFKNTFYTEHLRTTASEPYVCY